MRDVFYLKHRGMIIKIVGTPQEAMHILEILRDGEVQII